MNLLPFFQKSDGQSACTFAVMKHQRFFQLKNGEEFSQILSGKLTSEEFSKTP